MKKIISFILIAILCLGALTSCELGDKIGGFFGGLFGNEPDEGLESAKEYVQTKYNNDNAAPKADYDVAAKVVIDGVTYDITWTASLASITVKASATAGFWTVDLPDVNDTEVAYTLTATIKNADGDSLEVTFNRTLPVISNVGIVTVPEAGVAYKLFFDQLTVGQKLYALATTENNENKFINTTADPKAAADYYVEVVEGGYKFYTTVNGTKTYVLAKLVPASNGHMSKYIGLSATESSVFYYKSEVGAWFTKLGGAEYGVGTYQNYKTISISEGTRYTAESVGNTQFVLTFITKAHAETLAPDAEVEKEIPQMTGATQPAAGTAYNLGFVHGNKNNGVYYITGALDGYYMATTQTVADAVNVYVEAVEGGYNLYCIVAGEKLYINAVASDSYVNGKFQATASTVYTYDATLKTLKTTVSDTDYVFGTSTANSYTTIGPVKVSDKPFYAQFVVSTNADQTAPDQGGNDTPATDALVDATINNAIPSTLTYITNNPSYPNPGFYSSGSLKMNFVNMGVQTTAFAAQGSLKVTLNIAALNAKDSGTEDATKPAFTVTGLDASGNVVATATLDTVVVGNNTVTLTGEGIVAVKVVMTDYPVTDGTIFNVGLAGVKVETATSSAPDQGGTTPPATDEPSDSANVEITKDNLFVGLTGTSYATYNGEHTLGNLTITTSNVLGNTQGEKNVLQFKSSSGTLTVSNVTASSITLTIISSFDYTANVEVKIGDTTLTLPAPADVHAAGVGTGVTTDKGYEYKLFTVTIDLDAPLTGDLVITNVTGFAVYMTSIVISNEA